MRKYVRFGFVLVALMFAVTSCSVTRDLGTLPGGSTSIGLAINDAGLVAGQSDNASGDIHAFMRDASNTMIDLGTLPGGTMSVAQGINKSGQVVGYSDLASGAMHAFLWDPNTKAMTDLGTLGGLYSYATAINDAGQIVGNSTTATDATHAFLWDPSTRTMRDLGTLGGPASYARDINNAGQIVGQADVPSLYPYNHHAFVYTGGKMTDLGTLGGKNSSAGAINATSEIVGTSDLFGGDAHAAFWNVIGTTVTRSDLTTKTGGVLLEAWGINDKGQIAGNMISDGQDHAARMNRGETTVTDLGTLGGPRSLARAINATGQVTGGSTPADGGWHAAILTPGTGL